MSVWCCSYVVRMHISCGFFGSVWGHLSTCGIHGLYPADSCVHGSIQAYLGPVWRCMLACDAVLSLPCMGMCMSMPLFVV
jgi:hypothetical protein